MQNYELQNYIQEIANEANEFESIVGCDKITFLQLLETRRTYALEKIANSLAILSSDNQRGQTLVEEIGHIRNILEANQYNDNTLANAINSLSTTIVNCSPHANPLRMGNVT